MIVSLIKESVTLEPVSVMDFLLEMAFNVGVSKLRGVQTRSNKLYFDLGAFSAFGTVFYFLASRTGFMFSRTCNDHLFSRIFVHLAVVACFQHLGPDTCLPALKT